MTGPSPYPLPKGERVSEGISTFFPRGERGSFYTPIGGEGRVRRAERIGTPSPIGGEGRVRGQVCERPSQYTRRLRRSQTDAERMMWSRLRDRRLCGARFWRQHPIGPFITDFCCPEAKLVVELDGGQHALQKQPDAERTAFLEGQGYRVIRFWDNEALANLEGVLQRIVEALGVKGSRPSPCPLPRGGRVPKAFTLSPSGEVPEFDTLSLEGRVPKVSTLAPSGGEGRVRGPEVRGR
jgi:very-short-patch-repair endonuclease